MGQFYLPDRRCCVHFFGRRSVAVRVLLDPNRDAFGFETSVMRSRSLPTALVHVSDQRIALRWYRTSSE